MKSTATFPHQQIRNSSRIVEIPPHAARNPITLHSMNNLSVTLDEMGEPGPERKRQEEVLAIRRRVLGSIHPDTSVCAWNLFRTLTDMAEYESARVVLECDLLWLLHCDPASLDVFQLGIRSTVSKWVETPPKVVPERNQPTVEQRYRGRKVGRNDPCPCGSGQKFKKCHGT